MAHSPLVGKSKCAVLNTAFQIPFVLICGGWSLHWHNSHIWLEPLANHGTSLVNRILTMWGFVCKVQQLVKTEFYTCMALLNKCNLLLPLGTPSSKVACNWSFIWPAIHNEDWRVSCQFLHYQILTYCSKAGIELLKRIAFIEALLLIYVYIFYMVYIYMLWFNIFWTGFNFICHCSRLR